VTGNFNRDPVIHVPTSTEICLPQSVPLKCELDKLKFNTYRLHKWWVNLSMTCRLMCLKFSQSGHVLNDMMNKYLALITKIVKCWKINLRNLLKIELCQMCPYPGSHEKTNSRISCQLRLSRLFFSVNLSRFNFSLVWKLSREMDWISTISRNMWMKKKARLELI
jgi:hypothetical protein